MGIPCVGVSNVLSENKKQQVMALGRLGWSLRRIEAAVHIRRETVGAYLRAAGIPVRPPGGWGQRLPTNPAKEVITDSGTESAAIVVPEQQPIIRASVSLSAGYREAIELGLLRGRNAMAIWQDLVDTCGFTASYQSVQRFVHKLHMSIPAEARAVIETAHGEEAQVDYGSGPMVRDPHSGRYRRTRLFVLTLSYSRKCVRLLTFQSSTRTWAELHEQAFRRLGGATKTVVLDNLGEGVLKPDIYDPSLNPLYRDVLAHYGAVALPCRVGDARLQHGCRRGDAKDVLVDHAGRRRQHEASGMDVLVDLRIVSVGEANRFGDPAHLRPGAREKMDAGCGIRVMV